MIDFARTGRVVRSAATWAVPRVVFVFLFFSLLPVVAGSEWHVQEAPIRFTCTVDSRPSHGSAGYFVTVPDGGLLPGPNPVTEVVTEDGEPVESYTLWHSPNSSLALVFADAGRAVRRYHVYVTPSSRYRLWSPNTAITPSAIVAVDPARDRIGSAQSLAQLGRVDGRVSFWKHEGTSRAPLSLGGDQSGRPPPASLYMLAHVVTDDPGRTWIAPHTLSGESEVRVGGSLLRLRRRTDKWGGTGDWAEIESGPNRVEIFQTAPDTQSWSQDGLIYLSWRTPEATAAWMQRRPDSDYADLHETRIIRREEIVQSGTCSLHSARTRDGRPVALIRHEPAKVFWFDDETPLLIYSFRAVTRGHSDETIYRWEFENGVTVDGDQVSWIFPALGEHRVKLTAASPQGRTEKTNSFFSFSTRSTSLDNARDRLDYRLAMYRMLQAYPARHRAVENWDQSYWNTLLRTVELGRGQPLFEELFRKHRRAAEQGIPAMQLTALQDLYLDVTARLDPDRALGWIEAFQTASRTQQRRDALTIREAEVYMYYLDDLEQAGSLLRPFVRQDGAIGQRARVRVGDLQLLDGDLNTATRFYAEVQNRARIVRSLSDSEPQSRDRQVGRPVIGRSMDRDEPDQWKLRAMVATARSEQVRSYVEQGFYLEARDALNRWEMDLPLSKISGDYLVLEAMLYLNMQDPVRAKNLLQAFCYTVGTSTYLPEAASLLLRTLMRTDASDEEIREHAERLRGRLEFHPVAAEIDRLVLHDTSIDHEALRERLMVIIPTGETEPEGSRTPEEYEGL